jgi:hypothetical protein
MKVGVVPTKYGYTAVALPPYTGDWELYTPFDLPEEVLIQLRGQILHKLAIHSHRLVPWTGQAKVALPWAIMGGLALYLRMSNYMSLGGIKTIALYGWIMFLFFGDGIWALMRFIYQLENLFLKWQIKNRVARGEWVAKGCEWAGVADWDYQKSEREFIDEFISIAPETKPYYNEILRIEPPLVFSVVPLGILGYIKYLTRGPRLPRPALIFELGRLE